MLASELSGHNPFCFFPLPTRYLLPVGRRFSGQGGNLSKVFTAETRGARVALSQARVLTEDLGRKRERGLDV